MVALEAACATPAGQVASSSAAAGHAGPGTPHTGVPASAAAPAGPAADAATGVAAPSQLDGVPHPGTEAHGTGHAMRTLPYTQRIQIPGGTPLSICGMHTCRVDVKTATTWLASLLFRLLIMLGKRTSPNGDICSDRLCSVQSLALCIWLSACLCCGPGLSSDSGRREGSGSTRPSEDAPLDGMEHLFCGSGSSLRFGRDKRLEEACFLELNNNNFLCSRRVALQNHSSTRFTPFLSSSQKSVGCAPACGFISCCHHQQRLQRRHSRGCNHVDPLVGALCGQHMAEGLVGARTGAAAAGHLVSGCPARERHARRGRP